MKEQALSNFALQSFQSLIGIKNKKNFQMLLCVFEGPTNWARPSQPSLKNCQNGPFQSMHGIQIFWAKLLLLKCFESATMWLYSKNVSGSVQVLKPYSAVCIKGDKLDYFKNAP